MTIERGFPPGIQCGADALLAYRSGRVDGVLLGGIRPILVVLKKAVK